MVPKSKIRSFLEINCFKKPKVTRNRLFGKLFSYNYLEIEIRLDIQSH